MLEDKQGNITTSSFVQIRGSIPLLWSQIPNIKYKPPTRIAPPTDSHPAFDRHFKELLETYQVFIHHNLLAFGHCHRYLQDATITTMWEILLSCWHLLCLDM